MSNLFNAALAFDHVKHLAVDIGPRYAGTDGDQRAGEYIESYLASLGLPLRIQTFDVETGSLAHYKLEVLDPPLGEIAGRPVLLTPDTPPDGIEGELVYVQGTSEPQLGPHVAGKVVVWYPSPSSQPRDVLKFHPLALLIVPSVVGLTPRRHSMTQMGVQPYERVPSFYVTYEDGMRLARAGGGRVRLLSCTRTQAGKTSNIIAEIKGKRFPEDIVVVGAHRDTTPDVPGATDNAAGVGIVMELARVFAQCGSKRTLRFVAWGAEEAGLRGSRHYVRELKRLDQLERAEKSFAERRARTELERHLFYLNLDVWGMLLGFNQHTILAPADVTTFVESLGREMGIIQEVRKNQGGSDHEPFAWVGIPAVSLGRGGAGTLYMHGPEDSIDLVEAQQLGEIGRYAEEFLRRTADAHVWPFERRVPEAVAKDMEERMRQRGEPI